MARRRHQGSTTSASGATTSRSGRRLPTASTVCRWLQLSTRRFSVCTGGFRRTSTRWSKSGGSCGLQTCRTQGSCAISSGQTLTRRSLGELRWRRATECLLCLCGFCMCVEGGMEAGRGRGEGVPGYLCLCLCLCVRERDFGLSLAAV
jgi:hypothetical protein